MLVNVYITLMNLYSINPHALVVTAFLSSVLCFAAAVAGRYVKRMVAAKMPNFMFAFILTLVLPAVIWLLDIMTRVSEVKLWYLIVPLAFAIPAYVFFVLPSLFVYEFVMERYPMLPWHFMIYCISFAANLVFWYVLIYPLGAFNWSVVFYG